MSPQLGLAAKYWVVCNKSFIEQNGVRFLFAGDWGVLAVCDWRISCATEVVYGRFTQIVWVLCDLGGRRVCGTDGTASEIKLIFKRWRSQGLKNESWSSVQLRSSEQREANTAFLGAEQPPALLHSTFVLYPRSDWVYFQHKERWISSMARLHPFCPPALPEGIWEGVMPVKYNSSARLDRQEKACCL